MSTSLLNQGNSYDTVYNNFEWDIPEEYNIAYDVCDRWVEDKDRVALVYNLNTTKISDVFKVEEKNYFFGNLRYKINPYLNRYLNFTI